MAILRNLDVSIGAENDESLKWLYAVIYILNILEDREIGTAINSLLEVRMIPFKHFPRSLFEFFLAQAKAISPRSWLSV